MGQGVRALAYALFDDSTQPRAPLPPLRVLQLEGNELGPNGVTALMEIMLWAATPIQPLTTLTLAQNKIGDEGAASLGHLFVAWKGPEGCVDGGDSDSGGGKWGRVMHPSRVF